LWAPWAATRAAPTASSWQGRICVCFFPSKMQILRCAQDDRFGFFTPSKGESNEVGEGEGRGGSPALPRWREIPWGRSNSRVLHARSFERFLELALELVMELEIDAPLLLELEPVLELELDLILSSKL